VSERAHGAPEHELFEVFPTGSTIAHAPEPKFDDGSGMSERLRRSGEVVRDGYGHARDFHARPGHRPGGSVQATSSREGGDTDIVRPVLVDPRLASRLALSGRLFADPIEHLEIDPIHPGGAKYLVWDVRLATDRGRGVPATLHLLASPSMVVTVLELVPRRRLRWNRERFVRDGVAAVEILAHRLEAARPHRAA
jgi:hypothetical protein